MSEFVDGLSISANVALALFVSIQATSEDKYDVFGTTTMIAVAFTRKFRYTHRTNAALLLACSVSFWGMLMGASYVANLASSLVASRQPNIHITSLKHAVALDVSTSFFLSWCTY
jgi:hypothetical protein